MDIRENKPFTTSQIKNEKPSVPKTESVLSGYIANSFNAGHNRVIAWKQVMAGEKIKEYRLQAKFQMLTPITPSYQNLIMTIRTYFVPNSRIWKNAEKFTAQKESGAEIRITQLPNAGGKIIPTIKAINQITEEEINTCLSNTDIWRDAYISCYYPRITIGHKSNSTKGIEMPEVSILPLRGRRAIFNDLERNRDYENAEIEYNEDEVSQDEWESYLPNAYDFKDMRAKRNNSYYTNFRTSIQGFDSEYPPETNRFDASNSLITWAAWESKIAEARSEAQNSQMTDWDIIAKIRGSKKLTEGKVQLIGEVSFPLNYAAITQNTYNTNEKIREEFRVLGKQGAYSYTEINKSLFAGFESIEEGYIHIIATVSADTVFENAFNRLELNVNALDQYRPDLKDDKFDVLYEAETNANVPNYKTAKGFKRRFTEYFKLNNLVCGDMHNVGFFRTKTNTDEGTNYKLTAYEEIIPNNTFQFFETSETTYIEWNEDRPISYHLEPWKDYTDIQVNKNQAIKNEIENLEYDTDDRIQIQIKGQNQIFFVGKCLCTAILPISEEVKNDFTDWGEH